MREVYGDEYFSGGRSGYPDYLAMTELMRERGDYYAEVLRRHGRADGSICDIGAASGAFLSAFAARGFRCVGVEPNARMVSVGIDEFGLDLRHADLETFVPNHGECFDCVLLIQVIAHLESPAKGVELIQRMLRPSGFVIVETWNRRSVIARLAGRYWHEYSPPSVLQFFDRGSLDNLFNARGFERLDDGRPAKPVQGSHVRSALIHALGNRQVTRALTKIIPKRARVPYVGDDVFWALYRWPG